MKKYSKLTALILVIITFCTILCSCDAIDEMKVKQGFFQEDGTILFNNNVYVKMDIYSNIKYELCGSKLVYITEKNVPVLLSTKFGRSFHATDDNVVLEDNVIYVREDKYAQVKKEAEKAANGEFDYFAIKRYSYSMNEKETQIICNYRESQMIHSILSEVPPISYAGEQTELLSLYVSTENGYFGQNFGHLSLLVKSGRYVIIKDGEPEKIEEVYIVPEKYQKDMENIFSKIKTQSMVF